MENSLYFDYVRAREVATQEQNEKNYRVASILDRIMMHELSNTRWPLNIVEMGGGAHLDRYHQLFGKISSQGGIIHWVDFSEPMIQLAREYLLKTGFSYRLQFIDFVNHDMVAYLQGIEDESVDLFNFKYTFDHVKNLEGLMGLLWRKLNTDGSVTSDISIKDVLRARSTNAQYFYNGVALKEWEEIKLKDGDHFSLKFFRESGNHDSELLAGEITKIYYSKASIISQAESVGFRCLIDDWRNLVPRAEHFGETMDQEFLVLRKQKLRTIIAPAGIINRSKS